MDSNDTIAAAPPARWKTLVKLLVATVLAAWLTSCCVFVDETEIVLIERLGQIVKVKDREEDRGLVMKLPWPIDQARRFDRRVQLFDPPGREMFTRDKKNVTVEAFICWRIAPTTDETELLERPSVKFFRALGSVAVAQSQLETRVRSTLTSRIAQVELGDLMHVTDPESPPVEQPGIGLAALSEELLSEVSRRSSPEQSLAATLGIELVDVRIKRVNFPLGNQQAVFERMRSERQKIADRYRSAGQAESTVIRSRADRQYAEVIAKADAEAERIRGEAEAEALGIVTQAQSRDPDFYRQLRTLDAYKKLLNEKTTLVISASSGLFRMLFEGDVPQGMKPDAKAKIPE